MHQRSVESDTCTAISPFPSCLEYVKVWDLSRKLCCDTSTLHPSFSLIEVSNSSRCRSAAVALLLTRLRASGQKSLVAMIPLRRRKKHKNCLGQVRKSRKASATIAMASKKLLLRFAGVHHSSSTRTVAVRTSRRRHLALHLQNL